MWILRFKPVDCKNCYKCVRNCPVKAIRVKNHQAQIMQDACILCEKCTIVCPQHAKAEKNDVPSLKRMIAEGRELVASVNSAYIAKYGAGSFPSLRKALLELGFSDVREGAEGAYLVKREYERLLEEGEKDVMISSICPSVVRLVKIHYPELMDSLLSVLSPMQAHGKYLKEQGRLNGDTIVTTIMSNLGLYKACDKAGIRYEKTAVGDKYVYENMLQNNYSLGGEQSGHIIFSKYATTGDGILTSLLLMEVVMEKKQSLGKLVEEVKIYPQLLKNVRVADKKEARENPAVVKAVEEVAETLGDDGRILVRESGTEPVIRVMVEAATDELCKECVDKVIDVMAEEGLVLS